MRFQMPVFQVPPGLELDAQALAEIHAQRVAEDEAEVAEITRRYESWRARRDYARMGLDPGDGDAPANASAADKLLAWVTGGQLGRNALLWGGPGAGKTSCAKRVLLRFPGQGLFLPEATMASALRSCFRGTGDATQFMDRWCSAPLLVLDDMGKAGGTEYRDWLAAAVYEIADRRYSANLPTVVTANLCATDLVARFAEPGMREAVYSRLFAAAKIMHFAGPDHRADGAEREDERAAECGAWARRA